jgi:hypothetical protein
MNKRSERLMPGGVPRYVRCYDNKGASIDRYTVVFTGRYGYFMYLAMNARPFDPQGFGQHGESQGEPIDRPTYGHLGTKIKFADLPEDCQKLVISDYKGIWSLD